MIPLQTGQVIGKVTGSVKTQLIAHDKEVHDIAFTRAGGGRDLFASVGSDGSVRMFDLRYVERLEWCCLLHGYFLSGVGESIPSENGFAPLRWKHDRNTRKLHYKATPLKFRNSLFAPSHCLLENSCYCSCC